MPEKTLSIILFIEKFYYIRKYKDLIFYFTYFEIILNLLRIYIYLYKNIKKKSILYVIVIKKLYLIFNAGVG